MEKGLQFVTHTFPAVFDARSRVLILGSIPSPKSREQGFYYGHPRNRFWRTLSKVLAEEEPEQGDIEAKKALLLRHGIALWDVLASCYIHGADDGSISEPVPNDIAGLIRHTEIAGVFTTGKKADALYRKYCLPQTGIPAVCLPSTSPANCAVKDEALILAYGQIREALQESLGKSDGGRAYL